MEYEQAVNANVKRISDGRISRRIYKKPSNAAFKLRRTEEFKLREQDYLKTMLPDFHFKFCA